MPVALNAAVHAAYVMVPREVSCPAEASRLRENLGLLRIRAEKQGANSASCEFQIYLANSHYYTALVHKEGVNMHGPYPMLVNQEWRPTSACSPPPSGL